MTKMQVLISQLLCNSRQRVAWSSSDCRLMCVEVKLGGCRGVTVGPGREPNSVALLSDEIHAWRSLQKLNYNRQDRIQWKALTTQLLPPRRIKNAVSTATAQRKIFNCKGWRGTWVGLI